jgi:predicted nucleotidyltransferase
MRSEGRPPQRTADIDLSPLKTLLARIKERYQPAEVWLFGSRARGEAGPTSDWDLLVVVADDAQDADLDPLTAWQVQKGTGVYADVIPYRASDFRQAGRAGRSHPR